MVGNDTDYYDLNGVPVITLFETWVGCYSTIGEQIDHTVNPWNSGPVLNAPINQPVGVIHCQGPRL